MSELKPCDCGSNIDEHFRIQHLFTGGPNNIFVAYCDCCLNAEPFKAPHFGSDSEIMEIAENAWNARQEKQAIKQSLIDVFHDHSNQYHRDPTYKESVDLIEMVFSDKQI